MEMPSSTQALYFHLMLRADDDGFIAKPKTILKMIGASPDDYKVLMAKRYLMEFESGVCVIKHWLIHNLIRKDRYTKTQWVDEMNQLEIDGETKKYSLNKGLKPHGNHMATTRQPSIGKVRLGKDREREEKAESLSRVAPIESKKDIPLFKSRAYLLAVPSEDVEIFTLKFVATQKQVVKKAEQLHTYCEAKGRKYKNYKAFLRNALDKDFPEREEVEDNKVRL